MIAYFSKIENKTQEVLKPQSNGGKLLTGLLHRYLLAYQRNPKNFKFPAFAIYLDSNKNLSEKLFYKKASSRVAILLQKNGITQFI